MLVVDFYPDIKSEELLAILIRHREVSLVGAQLAGMLTLS